jgi:hypothetical protein
MSNALNRAERYRDLAEESCRLAATTLSTQMRSRYSRMAQIYTTLAEAEETRSASLRRLAAPVSSQKMLWSQTERERMASCDRCIPLGQ